MLLFLCGFLLESDVMDDLNNELKMKISFLCLNLIK